MLEENILQEKQSLKIRDDALNLLDYLFGYVAAYYGRNGSFQRGLVVDKANQLKIEEDAPFKYLIEHGYIVEIFREETYFYKEDYFDSAKKLECPYIRKEYRDCYCISESTWTELCNFDD